MKVSKKEFINLLDDSFKSRDTDIELRWAKSVLLCAAASNELNRDYICRLVYIQWMLGLGELEDPPGKIICTCEAVKKLGYEEATPNMFSDTRESERKILRILEKVNNDTVYDMIENQVA